MLSASKNTKDLGYHLLEKQAEGGGGFIRGPGLAKSPGEELGHFATNQSADAGVVGDDIPKRENRKRPKNARQCNLQRRSFDWACEEKYT